jgi:hypothetical protein
VYYCRSLAIAFIEVWCLWTEYVVY